MGWNNARQEVPWVGEELEALRKEFQVHQKLVKRANKKLIRELEGVQFLEKVKTPLHKRLFIAYGHAIPGG